MYGPNSYYQLGRIYPRSRLRDPWFQRHFLACLPLPIVYKILDFGSGVDFNFIPFATVDSGVGSDRFYLAAAVFVETDEFGELPFGDSPDTLVFIISDFGMETDIGHPSALNFGLLPGGIGRGVISGPIIIVVQEQS